MKPVYIRQIGQIDNHVFYIEWTDRARSQYRLETLQKNCPCAGCRENRGAVVDKDVRAVRISSVGRYAIRIQFTSGCSHGIFDFDLLREVSEADDG